MILLSLFLSVPIAFGAVTMSPSHEKASQVLSLGGGPIYDGSSAAASVVDADPAAPLQAPVRMEPKSPKPEKVSMRPHGGDEEGAFWPTGAIAVGAVLVNVAFLFLAIGLLGFWLGSAVSLLFFLGTGFLLARIL